MCIQAVYTMNKDNIPTINSIVDLFVDPKAHRSPIYPLAELCCYLNLASLTHHKSVPILQEDRVNIVLNPIFLLHSPSWKSRKMKIWWT